MNFIYVPVGAAIAKQGFWFDKRQQRLCLGNVMHLAAREAKRQWSTKGIDDHVDFRREPAARAV